MTSRIFQTFIVTLMAISTVSATDIFLPSLPSMTTYFGVHEDEVQLAIPIYLLGSLLAAPILGVFSDHFGRRPLMISGIGLFLFGTAMCIYSPNLPIFLTARFIQGLGAIASPVVGWAIIQDLYPADEGAKIMSWMGSIVSIAPFLAPGLGGYIHITFGWQGSFFLIFFVGAVALILMFFSRAKTKTFTKKEKFSFLKTLKIYARIIIDKHFLFYISFFAFLMSGIWCYLTIIPFYFENSLHLSPSVFGLYLSASTSFYIFGTLVTPFLLKRIRVDRTIALGITVTLIASGFLLCISFLAPTFPLFIVAAFGLYFFGTAIIWGPSTSRALQRFEDIRGAASAVRGLIITAAFVLGGFVGSILDDSSLVPLSLFLLTMAIGCWIILQKLRKLESHDMH